ncbi:PHD finger protein 12 [Allomyces arbusculus]|nr:PHD finger protein 12 [Allomyces arbusculus]
MPPTDSNRVVPITSDRPPAPVVKKIRLILTPPPAAAAPISATSTTQNVPASGPLLPLCVDPLGKAVHDVDGTVSQQLRPSAGVGSMSLASSSWHAAPVREATVGAPSLISPSQAIHTSAPLLSPRATPVHSPDLANAVTMRDADPVLAPVPADPISSCPAPKRGRKRRERPDSVHNGGGAAADSGVAADPGGAPETRGARRRRTENARVELPAAGLLEATRPGLNAGPSRIDQVAVADVDVPPADPEQQSTPSGTAGRRGARPAVSEPRPVPRRSTRRAALAASSALRVSADESDPASNDPPVPVEREQAVDDDSQLQVASFGMYASDAVSVDQPKEVEDDRVPLVIAIPNRKPARAVAQKTAALASSSSAAAVAAAAGVGLDPVSHGAILLDIPAPIVKPKRAAANQLAKMRKEASKPAKHDDFVAKYADAVRRNMFDAERARYLQCTPRRGNNDIVNQDTCFSCRDDGHLLCCEGCPRSFHLICLDPPLAPETAPDGEWFCRECAISRGLVLPLRESVPPQHAPVVLPSPDSSTSATRPHSPVFGSDSALDLRLPSAPLPLSTGPSLSPTTIRIPAAVVRAAAAAASRAASRQVSPVTSPTPPSPPRHVRRLVPHGPLVHEYTGQTKFPVAKRTRTEKMFAAMMDAVETRCPIEFNLPLTLWHRVDVIVEVDGTPGRRLLAAKGGDDGSRPQAPRLTDVLPSRPIDPAAPVPALCYACGGLAHINQGQYLYACSVCPRHWHLDCLPCVPKTIPPPNPWMCPCHVVWDLPRRIIAVPEEASLRETRALRSSKARASAPVARAEQVIEQLAWEPVDETAVMSAFVTKVRTVRPAMDGLLALRGA